MRKTIVATILMWAFLCGVHAQTIQPTPAPDTDLGRYNFFYAGQSKQRRMFIVKDGKVAWTYDDQLKRGEISDAVLMSDGHILVAHQYGIAEVTQDQQTVWQYPAPEGTEIHTIQPIGRNHVVFVQNGKPAKVVVMEIPTTRIVREFPLPISEKGSVHGQFRNARLSSRGTLLVANMALGCIHEFNSDGKEVDHWDGFLPWSVQELPKGNLLITGRKGRIQEITRMGETVWEMNTADLGITQPQKTIRLKNGHHLVNNWYNEWQKQPLDTANAPVQAVEIDKEGKVVWQLRAWKDPDLGPSTTIQLLDEPVNRDRLFFGEFNPNPPNSSSPPTVPSGQAVASIPDGWHGSTVLEWQNGTAERASGWKTAGMTRPRPTAWCARPWFSSLANPRPRRHGKHSSNISTKTTDEATAVIRKARGSP